MQHLVDNSYSIRLMYDPTTKALTPESWNETVVAVSDKAARRQFRKTKGLHPTEPLVCVASAEHATRCIAT